MKEEKVFLEFLQREIDSWEQDGLLPSESLKIIRGRYNFLPSLSGSLPKITNSASGQWIRWVVYLAIFSFLAAFFSFARSHSISLGPLLRSGILIGTSMIALIGGALIYRNHRVTGIALLILGGLLLPITFYFTVHFYQLLHLLHPYLWWSLLGLVLSIVYTILAYRLNEEGLVGTAQLSLATIPFFLSAHLQLAIAFYPLLTILIAFAFYGSQQLLKEKWFFLAGRPLLLLSNILAYLTLFLPVVLRCYNSGQAVAAYSLTLFFFFLQLRFSKNSWSIIPLVIAMIIGTGSFMQFTKVSFDLYPLVNLGIITILLGFGLLMLKEREKSLSVLLLLLLTIASTSTFGIFLLKRNNFRGDWLWELTIALYALEGLGIYIFAYWQTVGRALLSFLATWFMMSSLTFLMQEVPGIGVEFYSISLGCLLVFNALIFVEAEYRNILLAVAIIVLALPSLWFSWFREGFLRTVLLSLGGITLVAIGALRQKGHLLLLGVLVLLPAILLKLIPRLSELGPPSFIWFGFFGLLLTIIACWLQRVLQNPKK